MICMKSLRFLVTQEETLGARGHRALLEQGLDEVSVLSGCPESGLLGLPVIAVVDPGSTVKPCDLEPEF